MKSASKKLFSSFFCAILIVISTNFSAQAQFWTEDFTTTNTQSPADANNYVGVNGIWKVTSLAGNIGADANKFFISCTEAGMQPNNCGAGCPGIPPPPPTPFIGQSLHIGSVPSAFALLCPAGDCGAVYSAGDGGLGFSDATTEVRAESPTINCTGNTSIVLTFNYLEFGDGLIDNGQVWYFDGAVWALLLELPKTTCGDGVGGPCNTVPCGNFMQGIWTASPSISLPVSANNNPNVKIGFRWVNDNDGVGTDPSFAITHIQLTSPSTANTITANPLTGSPFCAGSTATLTFSSTGTFLPGNVYTAQLSNAAGSFAVPVPLGTFPSTANNGNITLTFPAGTPAGAGYMIQIVSLNPAATSNILGPFTITQSLPLSAIVTANPGTTICAGECITFTATPTNGGTAPTYQWQINGVNAPGASTSATYTSCTLVANDVVTVIVTSNLACVTGSPFTSANNSITITTGLPFGVSLTTVPSPLVICAGDPIQLTANTVNGGTTPTYQWTIDGTTLPGITTQSLNYSGAPIPITNGMIVCVIAASSFTSCVTNTPDTACATVTITTGLVPTITITSDTNSICVGGSVTFSSVITNGGTAPVYQWFVNSIAVQPPAGIASSFTTNSLAPGDTVSCTLASNSSCVSTNNASSNNLVINVMPYVNPTISIAPNSGVCPGQNVTFISTITAGGTNPKFQWYLNDSIPLGTSSTLTVNSSMFSAGDTVFCMLASNYPCLINDTVYSNNYFIVILSPATLTLGADVEITYGETYVFDPVINGPISSGLFLWTPDSALTCNTCLKPVASPLTTTDYVLRYTNASGCRVRDTLRIEVKPSYEVFIPTGFSPNGDNNNDQFYVRGPFIKAVNMKIWDRFGEVVFESPYLFYGWDGTKNYKDLNTGVYTYFITVTFLDNVTKDFKGNITLSR